MSTKILPNLTGRDLSEKSFAKKNPIAHVPQDLQFVNLPNDLKLDVEARRRVRSHVARDFRRRPKVSSSSGLDVDLTDENDVARDVAPGQKHRFRVGQQGLQETGKRFKRKPASRKVPEVTQDTSNLSDTSVVCEVNSTNDLQEFDMPTYPSLQVHIATKECVSNPFIEFPCSSDFTWDEYNVPSNQSYTDTSQYLESLQEYKGENVESGQLVRKIELGYNHGHLQKIDLASTGTGNLDPFNTLPVMDNSSHTQALMHHFHLRIMASPLMMNPRKEWFSIAIQDQALFHVALSHAAGNLGLLTQKGDSVESLMHRMEAIKIINERLNDVSSGISDGTVGAVASIASYEATNGTLEGVRTHMNGLEQMVRARGGFLTGGFSAHLRRLIAWADLNAANALSTAPRFPPLSDRKELRIDQFDIDPIAYQLYTTPAENNNQSTPLSLLHATATASTTATTTIPIDIRALPPKVAYCFLTLRQLSRLLAISGPKAVIRMDHTWYSDMAYTLQRRLMSLSSSSDPASSSSNRNPGVPTLSTSHDNLHRTQPQQYPVQLLHQQQITTTASLSRPCCLAALIYLECCIREVHPRSRIVTTLVSDLKAALLSIQGRASASASRLLYWALAVGAAASGADSMDTRAAAVWGGDGGDMKAEPGDQHLWFVAQLASLGAVLGVRGWEAARDILGGVVWPGRESEMTRALVWSEVEMADSRGDCWTVGSD